MSQGGNVPPFGDKESEDAAFNITYIDNVKNPRMEKMNNPNEQQNLDIIPPPTMRASTLEPESRKDDVVSGVGSLRKTFHYSKHQDRRMTTPSLRKDIRPLLDFIDCRSDGSKDQSDRRTPDQQRRQNASRTSYRRRIRREESREEMENEFFNGGQDKGNPSDMFASGNIINPYNFEISSDSSEDQSDPRTPEQQGSIDTDPKLVNIPKKRRWFQLWRKK